jgi:hypothetical protein
MKGLFSLALIGGAVYLAKVSEPELRRYLKIKAM